MTSSADQAARGPIRLKSNTTVMSKVHQIIIRNLKLVNSCDVGPLRDLADGATGNWNAASDVIGMIGSDHVLIDHNSFTDAPMTENLLAGENGRGRASADVVPVAAFVLVMMVVVVPLPEFPERGRRFFYGPDSFFPNLNRVRPLLARNALAKNQ